MVQLYKEEPDVCPVCKHVDMVYDRSRSAPDDGHITSGWTCETCYNFFEEDPEAKRKCPQCFLPLTLIGSIGILDSEDRWDAECMRYRCPNGHMVFIAQDAASILQMEALDAEPDDYGSFRG